MFFVKKNKTEVFSKTDVSTSALDINSDDFNQAVLTSQSTGLTINAPTGSPVQGQKLIIIIQDDGSAQTITFDTVFRGIGITLPTTTTPNKIIYIGILYNETSSKWDVVAIKEES